MRFAAGKHFENNEVHFILRQKIFHPLKHFEFCPLDIYFDKPEMIQIPRFSEIIEGCSFNLDLVLGADVNAMIDQGGCSAVVWICGEVKGKCFSCLIPSRGFTDFN